MLKMIATVRDKLRRMKSATLVGLAISALALGAGLARLIWPSLEIDSVTVALILIAVAPWLAPVFKSLKMPGGSRWSGRLK